MTPIGDLSQEAPTSLELNRGSLHRAGGAVRRAVLRNLWQGQLSEEFLVGLLSARFGLIGDLLEKGLIYAHRHGTRKPDAESMSWWRVPCIEPRSPH